jgi:hypothetical protein
MSWRRWADENGPIALLGAITGVVAFTYLNVFSGEPCGDDNSFHYAEIARLASAFGSGDLDAWNPGGNAGFASGYYYQVVAQAFPAALSALTGLSPLTCFQLAIFVPLVAAPGLAFRALRVAGATPWQAVGGAIALPFAIGTSRWGHDGTFVVGLYTQLWAFVAFPLAFAHAVRWVDEGRDLPSAVAWGLFCGLAHPFAGIALGLAVVAGMPIVLWRERRAPLLRLVVLGGLLVVGSACAWVPVIVDYDGFGGFPHRVADEVGPGFEKLWDAFAEGDFLDQPRPDLPVLSALLPIAAILGGARWMPRWWAAAAIFALLLGAGPHMPKIGQDDLLPAVRFWGSLQIVLALLAGAGVVAACERVFRLRLGEPWQPMVEAASATACLLLAIFVVATGLPVQRARVLSADDFPHIHRRDLDPLLATLRELPPGRTQIRAGVANHWAVALPYIESRRPPFLVMGGAPLQSSSSYVYTWELRDNDPRRAAWIFDAPYVLALATRTGEVPGAELVATSGYYALMRYPAPGLVGPVQVTGTLPPGRKAARKEAVRWLWSEAPYQDQVLAHAGSGGAGPPPQGRVVDWRRGGSWIAADVEADAPTTFVVRETWHPRWRATLDGAPVAVRHVTPSFMAIDVPPGAHTFRLEFQRPWWALALWLLWPAIPLAAWLTQRRARGPAAAA